MASAGGSMTLVFKRAALERFADPAAVFADARDWTEFVGLVSEEAPEHLSSYADRAGIDPDVLSSIGGETGGLAVIRRQFPAERHVFVGTTDADRRFAESVGWEYLDVETVADRADWTLAAETGKWREE